MEGLGIGLELEAILLLASKLATKERESRFMVFSFLSCLSSKKEISFRCTVENYNGLLSVK
uniref:Uncharacterized protein n=1 Tax=Anguilla anguilla TaxID=7936 RepID=A0A0E9WB91_ANGAN